MTEGYITRKLVGQPQTPGSRTSNLVLPRLSTAATIWKTWPRDQNMRWFPYGNLTQLQKISVFKRQTINGLCSSIFRSYVKLPKGNGQPTPPKKNWWLDQTQLAKTASAQESSSPSGEPPGKIAAYWRFSEGYILSDFHQH